ncbi:MAG: SDR family oxidoreductase [Actinomycetota bacterium]|nr:SDR family oxidoreductase [Actinomycetota bacterium]
MTATRANAETPTPVALVTGASRGLGRALATSLARRGWHVVVDGRDAPRLAEAVRDMPAPHAVTVVPGDVADPDHRRELAHAVGQAGGLDLLVNNASVLGPSPQPRLADYPLDALERVYAVNVLGPLGLLQLVLPQLRRRGGRVVDISSDAAVEAYEGWGGYGSAKAALDQLTAVVGVEHPQLRVYAFDPGDMATDLQQQASPGEDISDLPAPDSVVPALLRLVEGALPSGRYRAADLADTVPA